MVNGDGLVGKVSDVSADAARVTLITDHTSGVSAQVVPDGPNGLVKATVGNPSDLILDFVQKGRAVRKGATVVTSGWRSSRLESLFPRGIPIGSVTRVDSQERELYQRVHLRPFADLRRARHRRGPDAVQRRPDETRRWARDRELPGVLRIARARAADRRARDRGRHADHDLRRERGPAGLVTLSVGLLGGPIAGAIVGFLIGLVADMALVQTLGVTSLLLTGVGYSAGRYRELRDASHKLVPSLGGLVAALVFSACFALIQFLLGVESTGQLAGRPRRARRRAAERPVRDRRCSRSCGPCCGRT